MSIVVNGRRLGVATNGVFNASNTDPIRPFGVLWPDAAATWNDMRLYIGERHDWWIAPAGDRSHARSRPDQLYFWNHQPPPAARPYTSNHGWAIAVDVHHPTDAFYIRKYGHLFGWSHDEGARVGEWWHFRYVGTKKSPYMKLAEDERRWVYEYRTLKAQKADRNRRAVLRRAMGNRRKELWRLIYKKKRGGIRHRTYRYAVLRRFS